MVFKPGCVPSYRYFEMGAKEILNYHSLDPCLWLEGMQEDMSILTTLGIDIDKPLVVFRDEELFASYLSEAHGSMVIEAVRILKDKHPGWQFVYLPRYFNACDIGMDVIVPRDVVDSAQLLARSDLFIGGGGSMNIESAYFGVPTVNCRPMQCYYEQYLMDNGLTVKPYPLSVGGIVERSEALVGTNNKLAAKQFFDNIKFPTDEIIKQIELLGAKK
jgi:predicted glycosyltransferase